MSRIALISLSNQGAQLLQLVRPHFKDSACFFHRVVSERFDGERFDRIENLTCSIFKRFTGLVYAVPCGVVVRSLQGVPQHKKKDPAVVVLDVGGRYAISLLSGHEGGANQMALTIANIVHAEPVITTTTEALKTIIVGIGCRRGVGSKNIVAAINNALSKVNLTLPQVRLLASAEIKAREVGLLEAAQTLNIPIRFISHAEILNSRCCKEASSFTLKKVGLPGVSEPAALLAGRRTELLLPKTIYPGITVAIAREQCVWSVSDQVENRTAPFAPKQP